ncbi:MAG TPA: ABC transporter permease, partial [Myxococcaceae bacterium]|nr:ABC transporter permease [Myxococcaceae bacterium]
MGQLFLIAVRNLLTHRRRTLMLGGAIAAVTALLVLVMALSTGVSETLVRSSTTVLTGHLNVGGFYKVTSGSSAPVVTDYQKVEQVIREKFPEEVASVVNRGRGFARIISDSEAIQLVFSGIDIEDERGFREVVSLKEGRFEDLSKPNSLLLFEDQAKKLGVRIGDTMTLSAPTPRGTNNTLDVQLVAIARGMGIMSSFMGFLDNDAVRKLYQLNDRTTGALQIYLKNIEDVPS